MHDSLELGKLALSFINRNITKVEVKIKGDADFDETATDNRKVRFIISCGDDYIFILYGPLDIVDRIPVRHVEDVYGMKKILSHIYDNAIVCTFDKDDMTFAVKEKDGMNYYTISAYKKIIWN